MTPLIFLCEPSTLTTPQRSMSDQWHERLFGLGFDLDQVRREAYEANPWSGLLQRMRRADGVVVLGFMQLLVPNGTWRLGTAEEQRVTTTWTSPWLQFEAGLALASRVPVLVAPESPVSEGVFASDTWVGRLCGTPLEEPDVSVIDHWVGEVNERAASRLGVVR